MSDYDEIFENNEGVGIPYRGRCDDIKRIVRTFSIHLPEHNDYLNKILISSFSQYSFIKQIDVDGESCNIVFDQGDVSFSTISIDVFSKFGEGFYDKTLGKYNFEGLCHFVTLEYLKLNNFDNLYMVTSICVSIDNLKFFHSYVWDKNTNMVIDLARNITMNKDDFDMLFCYRQINVLSYNEFLSCINSEFYHSCKNKYYSLLFLALCTLRDEKISNQKTKSKHIVNKNNCY